MRGNRFTSVALLLAGLLVAIPAAGEAGGNAETAHASAPGQEMPSNVEAPSISGSVLADQALTASAGTWDGPGISYGFQWQRCDANGYGCASLAQALDSTYALTAADVGYTLRVVVTASNQNGSAEATSEPTATVAPPPAPAPVDSPVTSTPTSSPTTSFSDAYYGEHFDGVFSTPIWATEPFAPAWTTGYLNQAARLTDCAAARPGVCTNGTVVASTSSYGQLAAIDAGCASAHAGWVSGSGTCGSGGYGKEEDAWYRFRLRFPTGYQPTPGTQNTVFEFHVDDKSAADAQAHGYTGAYSLELGVQGQGNPGALCPGSPMLCSSPGTQPRLFMQIPGGSYASYPPSFFPLPINSLLLDHWYDVVLHVYWSADPAKAWVQWWLDGSKILDVHTPTLYKRTDGTLSYGENIDHLNYRLWATWASSIDFDELYVGQTASSVGFTAGAVAS
jgi:hypothetical protein